MSKRADKEWGEMWSHEKEMECGVALQTLAPIKIRALVEKVEK